MNDMTLNGLDPEELLEVAIEEALAGLAEGGIPIGGAIYGPTGEVVGRGHNRRVQHNDPSSHGETDAFRNAGRQSTWLDKIFVSTLSPCWYCSGLIYQFGFPTLIIGDDQGRTHESTEWLESKGVDVVQLRSPRLSTMLGRGRRAVAGRQLELPGPAQVERRRLPRGGQSQPHGADYRGPGGHDDLRGGH
jgi:cytosine deaminase